MNNKKLIISLIIIIFLSIPVAIIFGTAHISFSDTYQIFIKNILRRSERVVDPVHQSIIWELRVPRVLAAMIVGGSLAAMGCIMQAMTGNIMADPYILGVQSGAAMFAAFSLAFASYFSFLGVVNLVLFAFIGAILTTAVVYAISLKKKDFSPHTLILVGIAISMFCSAVTQLILVFAPDNSKVRSIVFWTMGGFGSVRWNQIPVIAVIFFIGWIIVYLLSEQLNILSLGKETAKVLGVRTERLSRILIVVSSLIVGTMVSISGSIGFVGLVIPHIARRLVGYNHKKLVPIATLLGALLLIWADIIARVIVSPKELPIGVITSILGVPFFLKIVLRGRIGDVRKSSD